MFILMSCWLFPLIKWLWRMLFQVHEVQLILSVHSLQLGILFT